MKAKNIYHNLSDTFCFIKITKYLVVFFLLISCNEKPYRASFSEINKYNKDTDFYSLIEHQYIFKKYKFKLDSLNYSHKNDSVLFKVNFSGNTDLINENSILYFHLYSKKKSLDFEYLELPLSYNSKNTFRFEKMLNVNQLSYEKVRFGIADRSIKKRLFVITLENVSFKKIH